MLQRLPKLNTKKRNLLLKRFIREDTAKEAALEVGINRNTANLYFNHFREKIYDVYYRRAPRFGGEVEVDQAFFGKGWKPNGDKKVNDSWGDADFFPKGFRVKHTKNMLKKIMVFGILNRGGDVYTKIIEKADKNTLLPIIHMIVEKKTIIYSDKWQGFKDLKKSGYIHKTINHSKERTKKTGKDGVHTGGIDRYWGFVRKMLSRFMGIPRHTMALHLKECEFRWNHKDEQEMTKILKKICF